MTDLVLQCATSWGEWNDLLNNDVMTLKRGVIELIDQESCGLLQQFLNLLENSAGSFICRISVLHEFI